MKVLNKTELTKVLDSLFENGWECVSGIILEQEILRESYTHYFTPTPTTSFRVLIPENFERKRSFYFMLKHNLDTNKFEFRVSSANSPNRDRRNIKIYEK